MGTTSKVAQLKGGARSPATEERGLCGLAATNGDTTLPNDEPIRRRSTRGPVPSKRQEQLQQIGTNAPQISHVKSGADGDAAWLLSSLENLATYDLGDDWTELVGKWASLERMMGQGNVKKGSLPVRGRPEEWAKWTSKSWRGQRVYDKIPPINDPADIGAAIASWWSSMQPSFRSSSDDLPLPVYSCPDVLGDPWAPLRKAGPNGFVSVIMLMAWWGRAAMTDRSEYQEDSLPLWEKMVLDVTSVLGAMAGTMDSSSPIKSKKRAAGKENGEVESSFKRSRH